MLFLSACTAQKVPIVNNELSGESGDQAPPDDPTDSGPQPSEPATCTPASGSSLKQLAIYYGWPSSFNYTSHAWDLDLIAADFSQYESVVLGAGLENPGHGDHANTLTILSKINPSTKVFGYLDIGNTNNYSLAQMEAKIDAWDAMTGIDGIFIDQFGFDFAAGGVSDADYRMRQKHVVDYIRSKGLNVFINAFDPDDVFVKESSNPLSFVSGDKFLYESYYLSHGTLETFSAYRLKVDKLKAAKIAHPNLEVYVIATKTGVTYTQPEIDQALGALSLAALLDGFSGVGWSEENFSAATALMPKQNLPSQVTTALCLNGQASVDSSEKSVSVSTSFGSVKVSYNESGGLPSFVIDP